MNPVAMTLIPPASAVPVKPGAAGKAASRDELAAFSPVLLTLLAPGMPAAPTLPLAALIEGGDPGAAAPGSEAATDAACGANLPIAFTTAARTAAAVAGAGLKPAGTESVADSFARELGDGPPTESSGEKAARAGVGTTAESPMAKAANAPAGSTPTLTVQALSLGLQSETPSAPVAATVVASSGARGSRASAGASPANAAGAGEAPQVPGAPVAAIAAARSGAGGDRGGSEMDDAGKRRATVAAVKAAVSVRGAIRTAPALPDAPAPAAPLAQDLATRFAGERGESVTAPAAGAPSDPRLAPGAADGARVTRPDQITLRVEGDAGVEARLRVAVRGRDVRATIVADDPALANKLEASLGNLRQALGERGFDRAQLLVQSADATRDVAQPLREPQTARRHADSDQASQNGRRSDTPEQRSRRHGDRNDAER
jgi:hypothetical protein